MRDKRSHTQHNGELELQEKRHTPSQLTDQIPHLIETQMPAPHAEFHTGLSYMPLGTLDKDNRPWASVLVTESTTDSSVGIRHCEQNELKLSVKVSEDDPFYRALAETKMAGPNRLSFFAGVGIDFRNRRRNKIAGVIDYANRLNSGNLELILKSDEHLGNCPKYITVRTLVPKRRQPETIINCFEQLKTELPHVCKNHIEKVSTAFLATKHTPQEADKSSDQADMGFNHRGGNPGFVRLYEDVDESTKTVTTYIVLPDFTGNRFYQSLGNIQSDKLVGLVLPDFNTGDVLHVTGEAENLLDDAAQALMPRMSLVTRIRITGAVFIKQAMDLELVSQEQLSPYNPPIRYLAHELATMGHMSRSREGDVKITATLSRVTQLTPSVSTFSFKLSSTIESANPGGFCIFDFSNLLNQGYNHMNEMNPQLVNEDYLRTWTISSAPNYNSKTRQFEPVEHIDITVKLKSDGLISPFLHTQGKRVLEHNDQDMQITLNGVGGDFTCFKTNSDAMPQFPSSMLWIAGGVGITPFMSMWRGVLALSKHSPELATDIVLVFAGRENDFELLRHFVDNKQSFTPSISITILAFLTAAPDQTKSHQSMDNTSLRIHNRRVNSQDISQISGLTNREVFLCGPEGLMSASKNWLQDQGVDALKVHQESFYF